MSAWSRSLYLDLAQQLACASISVNEAAGGATVFSSLTDYTGALATIACQLNAANNALGAAPVGLDFTNIPGLTQTIACLVQSMRNSLESPHTVIPYGSYDMYSQWNAIACNLNAIALDTGEVSPGGLQGGSIYAFMSGAICSMKKIASNGFGGGPIAPDNLNASPGANKVTLDWDPPVSSDSYNIYRSTVDGGPYSLIGSAGGGFVAYEDLTALPGTTYYYVVTTVLGAQESGYSNQASAAPLTPLQVFINSLLDFTPDLLIVADSFVGVNGAPVASAPDSSGNNNPMAQATAGRRPTLSVAAINGKNAYLFDGVNDVLQCPFPILTRAASVVVVNVNSTGASSGRMATTSQAINGNEGAPYSVFQYTQLGGAIISYIDGNGPNLPYSENTWASNANWSSNPTTFKMLDQGGNTVSSANVEIPIPTGYACIGAVGDASNPFKGSIAFHARWQTSPSDADMAAFLGLVNTYYGL